MMMVILPVKNESQNIQDTANRLFEFCEQTYQDKFKILFIDDDSSDDTIQKILELKNEKIKVLRNRFDRGKGSALKTGFIISNLMYILDDNDLICFMDGDGQINPSDIKTLVNIMDLNCADVVIGNKKHLYSTVRYSFKRKIVSYFYNLLVRVLFGLSYQDTQCGIKIFRKHALDLVIENITIKKFAFDIELIVALREMGMRVADAPVSIKRQINAGSVTIGNIINTFFDTINIWSRMVRGFYR